MAADPEPPPTFAEYHQALERLRRRAHLRRAVMTRGLTASLEMPACDPQEWRDNEICASWQKVHGFNLQGY